MNGKGVEVPIEEVKQFFNGHPNLILDDTSEKNPEKMDDFFNSYFKALFVCRQLVDDNDFKTCLSILSKIVQVLDRSRKTITRTDNIYGLIGWFCHFSTSTFNNQKIISSGEIEKEGNFEIRLIALKLVQYSCEKYEEFKNEFLKHEMISRSLFELKESITKCYLILSREMLNLNEYEKCDENLTKANVIINEELKNNHLDHAFFRLKCEMVMLKIMKFEKQKEISSCLEQVFWLKEKMIEYNFVMSEGEKTVKKFYLNFTNRMLLKYKAMKCQTCGKQQRKQDADDEATEPLVFKVCTACKLAYYCSKECQVKNWKYHKHDCIQLRPGKNKQ